MNYSVPNMAKAFITIMFGVVLGMVAVYIGEIDDSPGMMLIGMLLIIGSSAFGVKTLLRSS